MRLSIFKKIWSQDHPLNILFLLLAFIWSFYIPDDWDRAIKEIEIGIFNRAYNLIIYEPRQIAFSPERQENFTIIMADEYSLHQWEIESNEPYEALVPRFHNHAEVLNRILEAKPKLVIIDLFFMDKHSNIEPFLETLKSYHENNIPIIIPKLETGEDSTAILPEFDPYVTLGNAAVGDDNRKGILYELCSDDGFASLALQAYHHLHQNENVQEGVKSGACPPDAKNLLFNIWPHGEPDYFDRANIPEKELAKLNICQKNNDGIGNITIIDRLFSWFGEKKEVFCTPYPYMPAYFYSHDDDSRLDDLVHDSIILYGNFLDGSADIIHPVITQSPIMGGVSHIVALDNLLQFGEGYMKDDEPFGDLALFAMMFFIYLVFTCLHKLEPTSKGASPANRKYFLSYIFLCFFGLTVLNLFLALFQFQFLTIVPSNTATIMLAIIALSLDYFNSYIGQEFRIYKNKLFR